MFNSARFGSFPIIVSPAGNTLTGLDPHTTQPAADMGEGFPSEVS